MDNVNIFEQIHQFFEYFTKIFGQGLKSIDELPDILDSASSYIGGFMSCVHPRFIPLLAFALTVSLLFKFLRLDGIH